MIKEVNHCPIRHRHFTICFNLIAFANQDSFCRRKKAIHVDDSSPRPSLSFYVLIHFFAETLPRDNILVSLKEVGIKGGSGVPNISDNLTKPLTFTISLDDLAIRIGVNPVYPVSRLLAFTRFNLTAGIRWKFFDGSEGNCVSKKPFSYR